MNTRKNGRDSGRSKSSPAKRRIQHKITTESSSSRNRSIPIRTRVPNAENNSNNIKFGTILDIAVLAGIAAILSSMGNATVDHFNLTGQSAADVWWVIMGISAVVSSFLAITSLLTRGNY